MIDKRERVYFLILLGCLFSLPCRESRTGTLESRSLRTVAAGRIPTPAAIPVPVRTHQTGILEGLETRGADEEAEAAVAGLSSRRRSDGPWANRAQDLEGLQVQGTTRRHQLREKRDLEGSGI